MVKKKICLLGSLGVGKTSLVRKYVFNVFSDDYLMTMGVKIDRKVVALAQEEVMLLIWDVEGRDEFSDIADSYLRGMSGYFLVADGTRPQTLDNARRTNGILKKLFPDVPAILLVNKSDLSWPIGKGEYGDFERDSVPAIVTSARTGTNVEDAFQRLARKMIE